MGSVAAMLAGGCSDDDSCPACPSSPVRITEIIASPESTTVGDTLRFWAQDAGSGVTFDWIISGGRILYHNTNYIRMKAPDDPTLLTVSVVAFNEEGSAALSREIPVRAYLPREGHEPTYTGASYCGLECHGVDGHGDNYDAWVTTAHYTAYDGVEASANFEDRCLQCHTVGYGDVNEDGSNRYNGGFDDKPVAALHGIQCETCHGPLADRYGTVLGNHGELAMGDFLLETCAGCHVDDNLDPLYPDDLHAPQSNILRGDDGYTYGGSVASREHADAVTRSCVTCHYPTTSRKGGHTFDADPASCAECHGGASGSDFDFVETQMEEVDDLLAQLKDELDRATEDDKLYTSYWYALYNATIVEKDGSSGAHNYVYTKELLERSIADFEPSGQ